MKKRMLFITAGVLMLSCTAVSAAPREGRMYMHVTGGLGLTKDKVNITGASNASLKPSPKGFTFSTGVNYAFSDTFRMGLDGIWLFKLRDKRTSGTDDSSVYNKTIIKGMGGFISAYYDLRTGTKLTPFVTAGVGGMQTQVEDQIILGGAISGRSKKTRIKMAYQGGGGFAYTLSSNMDLEVGYRVIANASKKTLQNKNSDISTLITHKPNLTHFGFIGARVMF